MVELSASYAHFNQAVSMRRNVDLGIHTLGDALFKVFAAVSVMHVTVCSPSSSSPVALLMTAVCGVFKSSKTCRPNSSDASEDRTELAVRRGVLRKNARYVLLIDEVER